MTGTDVTRPGDVVPGAGTVICHGPTAGTWVTVDLGRVAARVINRDGRTLETVTVEQQQLRVWRARTVLVCGAVSDGRVVHHADGCRDVLDGPVEHLDTARVARAALSGVKALVRAEAQLRMVPAGWCPTCLGPAQ